MNDEWQYGSSIRLPFNVAMGTRLRLPFPMGSFPQFYGALCKNCRGRSSWPFWRNIDGCDDDDNPTNICGPCREVRALNLFLRIYPLKIPEVPLREIGRLANCNLKVNLKVIRMREYVQILTLPKLRRFTWYCSGDAAIMGCVGEYIEVEVELLDYIFKFIY